MAMPKFKRYKTKAIHIVYEDQMKWGAGMLELHLEKIMQQPELLAMAVRHAMLETLIPKLRQAWMMGLAKAVNMQVVGETFDGKDKPISNPRKFPTDESNTISRVYERLRAAQMRGDMTTQQKIMQDFVKHQEGYIKSLQKLANGNEKRSHYLSSGLFRRRATEVMHTFLQDP